MKKIRRFALVLALSGAALSAIACGGTVEQPQTQAGLTKAPIGQSTHGLVRVVGEALGEVPLRPEQREELEKLVASAEARHASLGEGRKELMLALAAQVETGAFDRAALQAKVGRIADDAAKVRPDDQQALARVHAILEPEQRALFVDALEARFSRGGKHHFEKPEGVRPEGARPEGHEGKRGMRGKHGMHGMHGMKQLAEELKLTDEQKSQIKEAFKASFDKEGFAKGREGIRDRHLRVQDGKKAFESFRTETFDAQAVAPPTDKLREMATQGSERFVTMAEKIVPILTPEQRKIAADKIRERAASGDLPFGR